VFDTDIFKDMCVEVTVDKPERDNIDDLGVTGRIILKRNINKEDYKWGMDYSCSEQ
jgi:hypothetical protein